MPKSFFEAIGSRLGRKAAQARNVFALIGGTDEESLQAEIRLGRDMAAALVERSGLVQENETTKFVTQIGRWLSSHVLEKKLPFTFHISADPEPCALALPGGPIFVSWPLLELCEGQRDQIAFVLGHEMAHIVRRHTLDRIIKDTALSLLLRQTSGRLAASAWLNQAGRKVLTRACSRENEFEADLFAQALVRTAGGDPQASGSLLQKFANAADGQGAGIPGAYLATHPSPRDRIANLQGRRPA